MSKLRFTMGTPWPPAVDKVFAVELTTAVGRCRGCGTTSQVKTLRVYGPEPGFVGRCPHCQDVLLRLVRTPDVVWLDFSWVSALRIPMSTDSAAETGQEADRL
jgi:hypothetical protein